jgi:hypothetical protein
MSDKPTKTEDEYFAREEALKLHKLHKDKLREAKAEDRDQAKELHFMKCSKCGWDLETIKWRDVEVEKCFHCGAIVLDDGELEKLAGSEHESTWLSDMFGLFKSGGE